MKPEESKIYSYHEYIQWEGRWELINGVPFNMSPSPNLNHQFAVGELYYAFRSFFGNKDCFVAIAPFDVRFSENSDYENTKDILQPDISVICNKNQLVKNGCLGAPTLVVEVLSPSTAQKDRNEKFKKYQQFEVKEYWIVDPNYKIIEVYGFEEGYFRKKEAFGETQTAKSFVFPDLVVDIDTLFMD
ncbi:Uma2 family endonuclease [Neobacillus sp. SM06]|uniref:Uma2 family endonuclease n=1 Tax=Neobacillus sp. SM06 TaxID=3422492 RepID=UPI003D2C4EDF